MKVSIETRHLGAHEINFATLTPAMQAYIIAYGIKQSVDDAGADPKKGADGSQARLAAILAGHVPAGGGGRLTNDERALRDVVEAALRRSGVKPGEAAKMARDPEAAITKAFGVKADAVMVKIRAGASTLAAARMAAVDIDLE